MQNSLSQFEKFATHSSLINFRLTLAFSVKKSSLTYNIRSIISLTNDQVNLYSQIKRKFGFVLI